MINLEDNNAVTQNAKGFVILLKQCQMTLRYKKAGWARARDRRGLPALGEGDGGRGSERSHVFQMRLERSEAAAECDLKFRSQFLSDSKSQDAEFVFGCDARRWGW